MTAPHGFVDYLLIPFMLLIVSIVWLLRHRWLKEIENLDSMHPKVVWVSSFRELCR